MRITRLIPLGSVLALGLAACDDAKNQTTPPSAPEPSAAPSPISASDAPNAAAQLNQQIASVCKAYRKARTLAKADLARTPNDAELQAVVKSYDEIIEDAC
ncbi:MAG: hypothetical protein ACJ79A_13315 [Gemmatimonadaceae bacterium]